MDSYAMYLALRKQGYSGEGALTKVREALRLEHEEELRRAEARNEQSRRRNRRKRAETAPTLALPSKLRVRIRTP